MTQNALPTLSCWHLPDPILEILAAGGSFLTALREWRGLSRGALSEISGVDLAVLVMAECGGQLVDREQQALATALRVDRCLL